uniref:mRNA capping enzyme adenylation domain-containing protein n=1 Tax=viral metagenome TaxID=1070528 RepID=A0A6C0JAW5_9ZZZZ|tara:strand:- start:5963 stop:6904 length:942 start_codon:yes stop_codon:yes gene_type:complete
MKLSLSEQTNILAHFPKLELSYEKKSHNKVHSDICLTIPKGKKYFAWFKTYKGNNLCFLLEIDRRYNSIENILVNVCCFDNSLCSGIGTILYGTIFSIAKKKFFNIENIYFSRGYNLLHLNQNKKLREIYDVMNKHIKQVTYLKNSINFGVPIIKKNVYELKKILPSLPYDIYCIQHRTLCINKPFLNEHVKIESKIYKIFLLRATIIDDIYELYFKNGENLEKYKVACIPNYKTSVMMNSLFRTIKENKNLDLLEESDDDEEFENTSLDKFVNLEKEIKMKCVFIKKFDSWCPIEISTDKISPRREIICYKK